MLKVNPNIFFQNSCSFPGFFKRSRNFVNVGALCLCLCLIYLFFKSKKRIEKNEVEEAIINLKEKKFISSARNEKSIFSLVNTGRPEVMSEGVREVSHEKLEGLQDELFFWKHLRFEKLMLENANMQENFVLILKDSSPYSELFSEIYAMHGKKVDEVFSLFFQNKILIYIQEASDLINRLVSFQKNMKREENCYVYNFCVCKEYVKSELEKVTKISNILDENSQEFFEIYYDFFKEGDNWSQTELASAYAVITKINLQRALESQEKERDYACLGLSGWIKVIKEKINICLDCSTLIPFPQNYLDDLRCMRNAFTDIDLVLGSLRECGYLVENDCDRFRWGIFWRWMKNQFCKLFCEYPLELQCPSDIFDEQPPEAPSPALSHSHSSGSAFI